MTAILAVRLDSVGDVLLTGPAIRALSRIPNAAVDVLASPSGASAAHLLPGVREVLLHDPPWSGLNPPPVDAKATTDLIERLRRRHYRLAVIFTSFHQSPLPMALLCRLAGIPRIAATSEDYPGSLLDVRHPRAAPPAGGHEVVAALSLAEAAGAPAPRDTRDYRLAITHPLPEPSAGLPHDRFVVVHPGASVPARAMSPRHARAIIECLTADGWPVVLTGGAEETAQVGAVAGMVDLGGRTDLPRLAAVLEKASCVVVGNTGPAHVAAAVGTPVVSLFSPVVPAQRWAPFGVPTTLLGDQEAACRETRARECPVPGHPCLSRVPPNAVLSAVAALIQAASAPHLDTEQPGSPGSPIRVPKETPPCAS